jgi:hypothetical protein
MKEVFVILVLLSSLCSLSAQEAPHYFVRVHDDQTVSGGRYLSDGDKLRRPDTYRDSIDLDRLTDSLRKDVAGDRVLVYIHGFSAGDLWYERYMSKQVRAAVLPDTDSPYTVILNVMYDTHRVYSKEKKLIHGRADLLAPVVAHLLAAVDAEISIMAHSMGNRVILDFLLDWQRSDYNLPIKRLVLAAADLPIDSFETHIETLAAAADTVVIYRHDTDRVLGYARSTDDIDRLGLNLPQSWASWPSNVVMLDGSRVRRQKTLYDNISNHRYHIMSTAGVKSLRYWLGIDTTAPCPYDRIGDTSRYIICQD